ncbi:hypothetical protein C8R43DRAFT_499557 [Mycena crocata]|nr:hypothetical protein C8R43DRAFT_499557 [Mycena crocata]
MSDAVAGTLWTTPGQFMGKAIKATAAFGGIKIAYPTSYVDFEDNYKEDFVSKFPHSKVPAWEGNDGFRLFESAPIARYIAGLAPSAGLLGKNSTITPRTSTVSSMEVSFLTLNPSTRLSSRGNRVDCTQSMDTWRRAHSLWGSASHWLTSMSQVFFLRACGINIDTAERKRLPHLVRHLETVINQPVFEGIFHPIPALEKAKVYAAPKKGK